MRLILLIAWLFAEAWSIGVASDALGGIVVFTMLLAIAAAGIRLIQVQGFRTLANMQEAMQRNELPAAAMLDGVIVFIAGVLLVVPGFISDGVALLLVFSGVRRHVARRAEAFIAQQNPQFHSSVVVEGEYHQVSNIDALPPADCNHQPDADTDRR